MRSSVSFGIAVLGACAGMARADEFQPPPMKDGLWETHSVQTMAGKRASDTTIKMCMSRQLTDSNKTFTEGLRKTNQCTSTILQKSGNTVVEESRCAKGPNAGVVNRVTYSHIGDSASHIEMRSQRGGGEDVTVMDSKYLSSCPAGMKPGSIIMPDGKVIGGQ